MSEPTSTVFHFAEGFSLKFPTRPCCNCGGISDIRLLEQDTRLTRYLLIGGTEISCRLILPFCSACAPTAKRRPVTPLHVALVLLLTFFLALGVALILGLLLDSQSLLEQGALLAGVTAIALVSAWYFSRRPAPHQTSYYQPVRFLGFKAKFFSGRTTAVHLAFTSPVYLRAFRDLNAAQAAAGQVVTKEL